MFIQQVLPSLLCFFMSGFFLNIAMHIRPEERLNQRDARLYGIALTPTFFVLGLATGPYGLVLTILFQNGLPAVSLGFLTSSAVAAFVVILYGLLLVLLGDTTVMACRWVPKKNAAWQEQLAKLSIERIENRNRYN